MFMHVCFDPNGEELICLATLPVAAPLHPTVVYKAPVVCTLTLSYCSHLIQSSHLYCCLYLFTSQPTLDATLRISYIQEMTFRYLQDIVCFLRRPVFPIFFTPFLCTDPFRCNSHFGSHCADISVQ